MPKNLVIVESPAKAKTIKKYLGKDFQVLASYGHVRDLIPKEGAVDVTHDFDMHYQPIERNAGHVSAIAKSLKGCDTLYLAPDPDREGEAIAWNLVQLLQEKKALKDKTIKRVVFHQITKKAVQDAIQNPREIAMDLVNAQQARRALDYLVGFTLSPLLWRKIRRGLSAGRVQSPALRMIVEREEEIEKFVPKEYWSIQAHLTENKQDITAKLTKYHGEKVEQFTVTQEQQSTDIVSELKKLANGFLIVDKVTKKQRKRNPSPPFITSTLQQEAARKLGFSAQKTMQIAQQLYEGIDTGEGTAGLITYMRTDSVNLANEALEEIREFIKDKYGEKNLPKEANTFKTKSKNAQEAHEAIRPTSALKIPSSIKQHLDKDQFKLYDLIWKRTIACQMIPATLDTVSVDFKAGKDNLFRASGSTIVDPGFMTVYQEGADDKKADDDKEKLLPPFTEGQQVKLNEIIGEQHFTDPPPRFSEASLIKALEEHDIGRPSTYASILSTLRHREYVVMDKKRFMPTDVGRIVSKFLTNYFTQYVDYDFTAKLEDELDDIARGEHQWKATLEEFWDPFKSQVDKIGETVQRSDVTQEKIEENCPKCGKQLSIRLGRSGRFVGCTGFPECDYTRSMDGDDEQAQEVVEGRKCPECQHDLIIRHGKYGKFIGCSNYPNCKHIEPLEKPKETGVPCPKCKQGQMLQRKSRRGKIFYSCHRYPDCDYAVWNEPLTEGCPTCSWPMLTMKETKRAGKQKVCPQKDCDFIQSIEDE